MKPILALTLLFLIPICWGLDMRIDVPQTVHVGDEAAFDYTLLSDQTLDVKAEIALFCDGAAPQPFIEERAIHLEAGVETKGHYLGFLVEDDVDSQSCTATMTIVDPPLGGKAGNFRIESPPAIEYELGIGTEPTVTSGHIFQEGDTLLFNTKGENVVVSVLSPGGTVRDGTAPLTLSVEGTYIVSYSLSKLGYRPLSKVSKFTAVQRETIASASVCNADRECTPGENSQNCPQDCPKLGQRFTGFAVLSTTDGKVAVVLWVSAFAFLFLSIGALLLYGKKR